MLVFLNSTHTHTDCWHTPRLDTQAVHSSSQDIRRFLSTLLIHNVAKRLMAGNSQICKRWKWRKYVCRHR